MLKGYKTWEDLNLQDPEHDLKNLNFQDPARLVPSPAPWQSPVCATPAVPSLSDPPAPAHVLYPVTAFLARNHQTLSRFSGPRSFKLSPALSQSPVCATPAVPSLSGPPAAADVPSPVGVLPPLLLAASAHRPPPRWCCEPGWLPPLLFGPPPAVTGRNTHF